MVLRNITADWGHPAKDWKEAMNQFAILYEDHFTRNAVQNETASHTEIETAPGIYIVRFIRGSSDAFNLDPFNLLITTS